MPKDFVKEIFNVAPISGIENFLIKGLSHGRLSNFLRLAVLKNFVGEPFCAVFQKISGSKKVHG